LPNIDRFSKFFLRHYVIFQKQTAKEKDQILYKKKIGETRSIDQRQKSGRPNHAHTEENGITVDELIGLLSHEGQMHIV